MASGSEAHLGLRKERRLGVRVGGCGIEGEGLIDGEVSLGGALSFLA